MSGDFEPGQPLTIKALSKTLGMGSMPVREGVQQLAAEGGFELLPNRRVRVVSLTPQEIEEVFQIRLLLEGWATERAALHMSSSQMKAIERALRHALSTLDKGDPHDALVANRAFHFEIYRSSRLDYLVGMIEQLWLRIGPLLVWPYRSGPPLRDEFFRESVELHRTLLSALRANHGPKAKKAMHQILLSSLGWYQQFAVIFSSRPAPRHKMRR
jgi:DNA-binding GntR family transcriptional regulator